MGNRRRLPPCAAAADRAGGPVSAGGGRAFGYSMTRAVGALFRGGLVSLPWVLMAESLPAQHFAKLALAVTFPGLVGGLQGLLYWVWALDLWGVDSFLWIILVEAGALAAAVACRPKPMRALS